MDALTRFEDKIEEALETSFTRLLRSQLQPVEIAKRLARAMERERTIGLGELLAPNSYEVWLSPADYAGLQPFRQALEKRLAEYLVACARERGLSLLGSPTVTMVADVSVPDKRPRVTARLVDAAQEQAPSVCQDLAAGLTTKVSVKRIRPGPHACASLITTFGNRPYALAELAVSIGRHLDNDIILDDPRVSRHHAQVVRVDGSFVLRDLASANGTWVNGARVSERPLRDGDVVSLGGVELLFRSGG